MRSNVNVSAIARAAGCSGARRLILCAPNKIITKISRSNTSGEPTEDTTEEEVDLSSLEVTTHRTLAPVLRKLKKESGYRIVGLEQTTRSTSLSSFRFPPKVVLMVGNERLGIDDELLQECDDLVEIPIFGLPHAHNASHAAAIAMYEYCRQVMIQAQE